MNSCWMARPTCTDPGSVVVRLDEAALERKLAAARDYPEMRDEVEAALGRYGRQAFAMECLRPAATTSPTSRFEQEPPDYERYGEQARQGGPLLRNHPLPRPRAAGRHGDSGRSG